MGQNPPATTIAPAEIFALALRHHQAGRLTEAERLYRRLLAIVPDHVDGLHLLGVLSAQSGDDTTAERLIGQALSLRPDYPEAHLNLGNLLRQQDRWCQAAAHYERALVLRPTLTDAYVGLGLVCFTQNRLEEAARRYSQALALRPDSPWLHKDYGRVLLKQGDFTAGFREYEWRWRIKDFPVKTTPFTQPRWDGRNLAGQTILLHAEQGLGDTLQFIRYAPLLQRQGARVVLECPGELVRLLGSMDALDQVFSEGAARPEADCHAPLLSLPHLLGTTLATIPAEIPYLAPQPELVAAWAARLPPTDGPRIGLVWAGNPRRHQPEWAAVDRRRSIALAMLAPLAAVGGIQWISLQKERRPELDTPPPGMTLIDVMDDVVDFADTAALMAALDLVIGVDTAVIHLAGALGRPAWLLSRFDGCWRWLQDRDDSPWYPSLRLFRQPDPGDWKSVILALVACLGDGVRATEGVVRPLTGRLSSAREATAERRP